MKKTKNEILFYIYLYLNVFCKGIGLSNTSLIYSVLLIFGIFILLVKVIKDKYTKKEIIFIFILNVIGMLTFIVSKSVTFLNTTICLSGMKNINIKKIFKGMLIIRIITFLVILTLVNLGIIENTVIVMYRNGQLDTRYALGFEHPNTLHFSFFMIIVLFVYNYYKKIKNWHILVLIILNCILYKYSISKTGFSMVLVLLAITLISKFKKTNKFIVSVPIFVLICLISFSFVSGLLYDKVEYMSTINDIFNGRIRYSSYYLNNYAISLFGHKIKGDNYVSFDNGYLYTYVQYGIVGFFTILYIQIKVLKKIKKEKKIEAALISICILIYMFNESFMPNIFMNIIILFMGEIIFLNPKKEKEMIE